MKTDIVSIRKLHLRTNKYLQLFLRAKKQEEEAIRRLLSGCMEDEPSISFDDTKRIVYWGYRSMKLPKKQYRFIHLLWKSKNHTAAINDMEESIWQTDQFTFVEKHVILMLVSRVRQHLKAEGFPYSVESVKNPSTRETGGVPVDRPPKRGIISPKVLSQEYLMTMGASSPL